MTMIRIPFSVLPAPLVISLAKKMIGVGNLISRMFPGLKMNLLQADIKLSPKEYGAVAFIVAVSNMVVLGTIFTIIGLAAGEDILLFTFGAVIIVAGASFFSVLMMPKVMATKRVRSLENNLIPALRQLLIEIRSGVTLFQAMGSVTEGYGEVSAEFKRIVEHINVGVSETEALNDASRRNLSFKFRRVLWHISNSLTVGSDIAISLTDMIEELTKEKMDDIRRYGQELNPWTMMYMMLAVVMPSLGITIAAIILSFLNISLPKNIVLPGVIIFLMLFQIFFINFVKSRRPQVE
ncbi:MAG: type II secretion system F family protein [Candidatus Micrarchaeota archaeon]